MKRKLHTHIRNQRKDRWLARGAVIVIVGLQGAIVNDFWVGSRWFGPIVELALLIPLSIGTILTYRSAMRAESDEDWDQVGSRRRWVRRLAIALTALSTILNFVALFLLTKAIFEGHAGSGRTLLLDAINIWVTNVVVFALWFWTLDRGGPSSRGLVAPHLCDFVFTQQALGSDSKGFADWSPGFVDYLFLAYTNATAFSPADTFPLTPRAKLLMMAESFISLITIALVASRAVGILG
ncbi:MAG: hypothetical protein JWR73_411 [Tardiphaga sp.]|jgi:hypothetical protein|nr:hypothetical protein [Tardiphaga sp.]MDB5547726.1 hypothetical protein [Tardiphaga sp.]MDB5624609.1 hypothetical protein [Tardiphaga sp.]MDB5628057.1 hypothetical protein [Tardiphaga sp.]